MIALWKYNHECFRFIHIAITSPRSFSRFSWIKNAKIIFYTISWKFYPSKFPTVLQHSSQGLECVSFLIDIEQYLANSQSFSSDDLLSELENSADDLKFRTGHHHLNQYVVGIYHCPHHAAVTHFHQLQLQLYPTSCNFTAAATLPPPTATLPPPLFLTLPTLKPVEEVTTDHPGTDVNKLKKRKVALACEAVIGHDELIKYSLSGRKNAGTRGMENRKLEYINSAVRTRPPNILDVDFEEIWASCCTSISKSCHMLRSHANSVVPVSASHYSSSSSFGTIISISTVLVLVLEPLTFRITFRITVLVPVLEP